MCCYNTFKHTPVIETRFFNLVPRAFPFEIEAANITRDLGIPYSLAFPVRLLTDWKCKFFFRVSLLAFLSSVDLAFLN